MNISLEFAHTSLAAIERREIARSAEAAAILADHLRQAGHDVSTVVLFDDKKVERYEAELNGKELLEILAELGSPPDAWWYERDLQEHLAGFCELLPEANGRRLAKSAERRLRKHFSLPCSVDIALWHALRLGIIKDPRIRPADLAISVLSDVNQEWEETARRAYLDHLPGDVRARVACVYYPESVTAPLDPLSLTEQLDLPATKETSTSCPAS